MGSSVPANLRKDGGAGKDSVISKGGDPLRRLQSVLHMIDQRAGPHLSTLQLGIAVRVPRRSSSYKPCYATVGAGFGDDLNLRHEYEITYHDPSSEQHRV